MLDNLLAGSALPCAESRVIAERVGHAPPRPKEATRQGGLGDAEADGGFAVAKPGDVHCDQRIAKVRRSTGNLQLSNRE